MDKFIGSNIKKARIKAGFTQEKLAEKIDVSLSVISRLKTGRTMVSVAKLLRIAQVLNVSVTEFFTEDPDAYPQPQDTATLANANAAHIADDTEGLSASADEELYFLIQQLPDKGKEFFKKSLRCYLETF